MSIRTFLEGLRIKPTAAPPSSPLVDQIWCSDGTGSYIEGYWFYHSDTTWHQFGGSGGGVEKWITATSYVADDVIWLPADDKIYRCVTPNSDVAFTVAKWAELSGAVVIKTTNISSATTGTFNTSTNGVPVIQTLFWDNAASKYNVVSPASLTIDINSAGNAISYDTTSLTFLSGDFLQLVVAYNVPGAGSVSTGNLTSSSLTITNGTGSVVGTGTTIEAASAASSTTGLLTSTDWNKFHQNSNYIANFDALVNTSGWNLYKDAAGSAPVDGTLGTPTVMTINRNTTTPLRNGADFKLSKTTTANAQGEGVSYDFIIAKADQSKPCYISGDYSVTSNYSYVNNDLVFYIYDITNAVLIQPVPYTLDGSGRFKFEFQSNAGSVSYRLIMHVATSTATVTLSLIHI